MQNLLEMKKILLTLTIIVCSFYSIAQSFSPEFDHSTILVENLEKSAEFYKNIVHLKELETPWEVNTMVRFFEIGNNQQLHVAHVESDDIKLNKVLHLAFAINDFDGYLIFLNDKGIDYSNFDGESKEIELRPDGVRQIYFQDPDGYWIEVNNAKH